MPDSSRREFLKLLSALAAGGLSGSFNTAFAEKSADASKAAKYLIQPWKGDDFTLGHRLRDKELPKFPDKAERKVDFIIVGGGMAGLACAHYLKGEEILLLEQYGQTGGTSSGSSYRGIDYSMGAVCTGSHEGIFGQLFDELKIKPAVLPADQIAWHADNQWYRGNKGKGWFYAQLNKLSRQLAPLTNSMESSSAEERLATARKMNASTFDKLLAGYDKRFIALISNICKSFYCADPSYVTAMAGAFMIRALTTTSYVFEGGNSGIAGALKKELAEDRCKTSSFVWLVEQKDNGASVVYSDAKGMHRVDCRHAVVTTPPLVTLRIVPQLPKLVKEKLSQLEYGPFLVANFCMKHKVFKSPYQSFADEEFPFCQMVMAEAPYEATGKYKPAMGSVLTVYYPYQHGPGGRAQMLADDREKLAESLSTQLDKLMGGFQGSLEEIVLTRWGHALIVPKPGTSDVFTSIQGSDPSWMTLAHSSSKGGPSLEGAILAARYAADRCLAKKS